MFWSVAAVMSLNVWNFYLLSVRIGPAHVAKWLTHSAVMRSRVAGLRLSPGVSAYQRIISNNSYAHDEQGVNPGRQEGSTVSSISYDHADALINSVKVSAALT